ncbi:glucohydrolase [Vibrio breoganii]|uniref:glycoside hydrolase family 13 protein n=1 Tax=Vibrio breoganii TaxID=553239 RepID=UPI000C819194|nr:alpha-glucosidase [Vibrio breoganii]PMI20006.1 glucohydrolase [Vibrio breoganii]PMJ46144.1 glucohydrolase [Vibrio breoganii]PMK58469.1 glucohydrolase [Vibrio breoganii]PML33850.1 glucohydrolase [Vibrio breoganii]PMM09416.1 glucohydrolase [Vibrio breoganii]
MDKRWWHDAVVYQIYPRSFCDSNNDGIGDLAGIRSKLDYLQTLGVNVLWLSPVYKSPMDDNGYDISDYQDIAPEFGDIDDMKALLAEAKQRDIKVVMDLVVNHTSDEHPWFLEAKKSKDNPYRDYYLWKDEIPQKGDANYFESVFGGPAWEWSEETEQYFFHLFSKRQPDLNWENPKVQEEVHKMMNWWIDLGIGGFRLDVIDLIGKEIDKGISGNGPRLHPLIQEMNKATFGKHDLLTVGETWDATPEIAKLYSNPERNEFSMVFQFEHITLMWEHGDKWNPKQLDLREFKKILTKWQVELANDGWNSLFWNNHDLPRVVSKYGDEGKFRVPSAKMLATTMHFLKGTPYIYQGEEIGMTNVKFDSLEQYRDIETLNFYDVKITSGVSHEHMMNAIHENSRDNSRTPMQWDDTDNGGFTGGKPWIDINPNYPEINVKNALDDENSIFYHYQRLISLRKENPVIVYGDFVPVFEESDVVFAYIRQDEDSKILVINNFSSEPQTLNTPTELVGVSGTSLISNYTAVTSLTDKIELKSYESFAIKLM